MNILCDQLNSVGWEIALVPINSGPLDQVQPKCEVFTLNRTWDSGILETLYSWIKYRKVIRNWLPDIIVLNCALPEFFAAMYPFKCKYVTVEHSRIPWLGRSFLGRICRMILNHRKTSWISVSSQLTIWPSGEKPNKIIENAIHIQREHDVLTPSKKVSRIVFIGRLASEKNPQVIIELARRLRIMTLIIGDGSERETLEELVREDNLPVTFTGHLTDPWSVIQNGDLLVVPSKSEGDGLVIIEALNIRMPILLANITDFQRFNFNPKHYFQDITELEYKVLEFKDRLHELEVDHELAIRIVGERKPEKVGEKWEEFLMTL